MKLCLVTFYALLSFYGISQVLDKAQGHLKFVHANTGLTLRDAPSTQAKQLERIEYGTELIILSYSETKKTIKGLSGKWAEVSIDKQRGYVFDAYLSQFPIVHSDVHHPDLCEYIFTSGDYIEGEKNFEINDDEAHVKTVFEQGEYSFHGDECDSEESLDLKNIGVQEAYVVFSGFIPTYGNVDFSKQNFEWNKEDGVWVYNFDLNGEEFTHWYHVTYTRNKQDEFDYMEVYFDWEGGGGSLKIIENKKIDGVTVKKYYGCH